MTLNPNRIPAIPLLLLGCVTLMATPAATAATTQDGERLPEQYRKWLEQEVVYIISDRERDAFLELQTIDEWEAFIDAFWRRRDPDRLTQVNEYKEEHYRRLEYVERNLGRESAVPGWMTDRGKMYIILGEPDDRSNYKSVGWLYPTELWFYLANREKGLPPMYLLFFQRYNAGPYKLYNQGVDQPEDLFAGPQQIDDLEPRRSMYNSLQNVSPELAHATFTMQADRGVEANLLDGTYAALDSQIILGEIYTSPFRRLDTSYVDAARDSRGLVETDYLFNYVPAAATANVMPGPGGSSFVHYSIEVEPQHFTLIHDEKKKVLYTRLIVQGEVNTLDERPVVQLNKDVYVNLTEGQFSNVAHRPFSYRDMFPLVPGEFNLRIVLKNEAGSEYTVFEKQLHVPERTEAPSMDPPVLLYGTGQETGATEEYRTYQLGWLKLEPNTTRVYAIGDTLQAHVPIRNASDQYQLSLRVVNQEDPTKTLVASNASVGDYARGPVIETLSLAETVGGRYRLIAELRDPAGAVVETQSADFDITPRAEVLRPWSARESIEGENQALVEAALAEQYILLGERAKAREAAERALEGDPSLIAPRVHLGTLLLEEDKPGEALEVLEPAYAQDPENVDVLLAFGDANYRVKNFPRAAELFEATLIRRRPDTAVLNALAVCYGQMGNRDKVLEYLERSLELDPDQEPIQALKEHLENAPPPPGKNP